ncbi:hypothetical protein DFH07DRAFT_965372 [Mycena maculata]|uniref:Uncharacterized protein n=1 Tax=Mycena maculata TaxID=230809 RepID=A0AAD7ICT7_9AGAR|nr:hypothetical protein DFH07DRAFT_965372 [Mycena maculata]
MDGTAQTSVAPSAASAHAIAQAKYRLKNAEAERLKAKSRMQKLREARKRGAVAPTEEVRNSHEFREFREYMDTLVHVWIDFDDTDPEEVAQWEEFLATNPSTLDLEPFDISIVEEMWQERDSVFPEWREELADYRDFVNETTAQERGERLKRVRAEMVALNMIGPRLIRAPGGF